MMKALINFILRFISILSPVNPYRTRVLVYHSIGRIQSEVGDWLVSEDAFEAQIKYLVENEYNVIGLSELCLLFKDGKMPPPKTICITFDDGLLDNYEVAAPILDKYSVPASFFIVAGILSDSGICLKDFSDEPGKFMSQTEMFALKNQSHELGSHALTHQNFSFLEPEKIYHELSESKIQIEKNLDIRCRFFVCPFGITQNHLIHKLTKELLLQCGYEMAFLGRFGACKNDSDIHDLPRITIYGRDNINVFKNKIDGSYDWIEHPLILFKSFRYQIMSLIGSFKL